MDMVYIEEICLPLPGLYTHQPVSGIYFKMLLVRHLSSIRFSQWGRLFGVDIAIKKWARNNKKKIQNNELKNLLFLCRNFVLDIASSSNVYITDDDDERLAVKNGCLAYVDVCHLKRARSRWGNSEKVMTVEDGMETRPGWQPKNQLYCIGNRRCRI